MSTLDYCLVCLVVFGVGLFVLTRLSSLLFNAARNPETTPVAARVSIGLFAWAIIAIVYSILVGLTFPKLLPMLVIPWTLGGWLAFTPAFSAILKAVRVEKLIALSTYRIAGFIFIYCYYSCGTLSRGFALNAGWGDVLTGVLAIPVAVMVKRKSKASLVAFVAWSFLGIADLIVAPASAAIYGPERLVDFPINLIPLFLGPPFGILLHFITIRAYFLQKQSPSRMA